MDTFLNDPAGRLYRFFEHCASGNPNQQILEAWRMYLELPDGTPRVEVLKAVSPFFSMPSAILEKLRSIDHSVEHIEDYGPALEAAGDALAMAVESTSPLHVMNQKINGADVTALRACSRVLQRIPNAGSVSEDQLKEVRASAEELIDSINEATDLPGSLRATLLGYAHAAILDVDRFRVGGLDALVRDANEFRGQLDLDPGKIIPPKTASRVWKALVRYSEAMFIVATLVHTPLAIGEDANSYRESLQALTVSAPTTVVAPAASPQPADSTFTSGEHAS